MGKIVAGIVLYNPEDTRQIEGVLNSVLAQVKDVYIFDNSTKIYAFLFLAIVTYLIEHENKGIAYAMNRIMEKAESDAYEWIVTMDQESVIPDGLIGVCERSPQR